MLTSWPGIAPRDLPFLNTSRKGTDHGSPVRIPATLAALSIATLFRGRRSLQTSTALAPAAPAAARERPDWTFTGNLGLYSQYVFRGVSQTNEKPAVQGGLDLGAQERVLPRHVGARTSAGSRPTSGARQTRRRAWNGTSTAATRAACRPTSATTSASSTTGIRAAIRRATCKAEHDRALRRRSPGSSVSLKYSYSVNNKTFGFPDSRGSSYLDLTANYDVVDKVSDAIGKVTLIGHVGHQWYTGNTNGVAQQQLRVHRLEGRRVDRDLRPDGRRLLHRHQRRQRALHQPVRQEDRRLAVRRLHPEDVLTARAPARRPSAYARTP